jgi:flagellar hook assembly protein FlgD
METWEKKPTKLKKHWMERYSGKLIGCKGTSLSVYNQQTKTWKQALVDNQGGYFDFTGEILREELGVIRISNNISDYAWDGRDEYGDQLANGTYFYKVYIQQNGQQVSHRETLGDKGFKNGFGKMQLLR